MILDCFTAKHEGKLNGLYLPGHDKILFTDGRGIGVRRDYNGVLLLDTILQTPITKPDDVVKLELLLSEVNNVIHELLNLILREFIHTYIPRQHF